MQIDCIIGVLRSDILTVQADKFQHAASFGGKAESLPSLQQLLGFADIASPLRCMFAEHCLSEDARLEFRTSWGEVTSPAEEWEYVVGVGGLDQETWTLREPKAIGSSTKGQRDVHGRNRWSVLGLHHKKKAYDAGLSVVEVCALRLFTGPMYALYNHVLRMGSEVRGEKYANTILGAVSGIVKLSAAGRGLQDLTLYRALKASPPPGFFDDVQDSQGFIWLTDPAFLSVTASINAANGQHFAHDDKKDKEAIRSVLQ